MKDLRKLNFEELIRLEHPNISEYSFKEYRALGFHHPKCLGYCVSCEEQGFGTAPDNPEFKLTNISHGAHSSDFFLSTNVHEDFATWHLDPVMFVYETPSLDYGIYEDVTFGSYKKRPAKEWYWIHNDQEAVEYPHYFRGGAYGGFVLSAIQTFKLKNVYMTNLVKCGMNDSMGHFLGLNHYNEKTIKNCFSRILQNEIALFKPKVIFAVGSAVEEWLVQFCRGEHYIQQLPHPAGRRRGLRDDHYKALYFWGIARALHKAKIIDTNEGTELARLYLENYE